MKIKLIESGGIVPVNKEAELEVGWTKEECDTLLKTINYSGGAGSARDAIGHSLVVQGKETDIQLSKVPAKYKSVFNQLVKNLQFVKH